MEDSIARIALLCWGKSLLRLVMGLLFHTFSLLDFRLLAVPLDSFAYA